MFGTARTAPRFSCTVEADDAGAWRPLGPPPPLFKQEIFMAVEDATGETWLFTLAGGGRVGAIEVTAGMVVLEGDRARIEAGPDGLEELIAYVGSNPAPDLLRRSNGTRMSDPACDSQRAHSRPQPRSAP